MEPIIYSFALAKSLHEFNSDYFNTFVPFVCMVLADMTNSLELAPIKQGLKSRFGLDIPSHVVKKICESGIDAGYLSVYRGRYNITLPGQTFTGQVLRERDIERKVNKLAKRFSDFIQKRDREHLSINKSLELLLNFIKRNLMPLTVFVESPETFFVNGEKDKYARMVARFLINIELEEPELFAIASDLVYGSVLCTAVQGERTNIPQTLKGVNLFLDTNVLFGILEFDHEEVARPRKELLQLLHAEDCNLFVFDFTIDEMVTVLKGYSIYFQSLWPTVKVDSVYSNLRRLGKTPQDINSMIANLERSLQDLGICVYETNKDIFKHPTKLDTSSLITYKSDSNEQSRLHDIFAIQEVENHRGSKRIRKLEEAKYIFVSADNKLAKYDLEFNHHNEAGSIPSVISDSILTQILWMKNPTNTNLPLYSAIAAHSRNLFVDRNVWRKFCDVVKNMDEKTVSEEISTLFLHEAFLEEKLAKIKNPECFDEKIILSYVEEAQEQIEHQKREVQEKYKQMENSYKAQLEDLHNQQKRRKAEINAANQEIAVANQEIGRIDKRLHTIAKRRATFFSKFCSWGIILGIVLLIILACFHWGNFVGLALSALSFFGVSISKEKIYTKINEFIFESIHAKLRKRFMK